MGILTVSSCVDILVGCHMSGRDVLRGTCTEDADLNVREKIIVRRAQFGLSLLQK